MAPARRRIKIGAAPAGRIKQVLAGGVASAYLWGMSKPADPDKPAAPPPATPPAPDSAAAEGADTPPAKRPAQKGEIGGPAWPEPTRYGDWERGGRVSDF